MILRTILVWCLIVVLESIVVILVVPPTVLTNSATKEYVLIADSLGTESATQLQSRARESFDNLFLQTGIVAESFALFVPTETQKRDSRGIETLSEGLFDVVRRRIESFWNLVFVGLQRAYAFIAWLPMLIPFLVAAAFDGATERRIKLLTFGMSSAPLYGVAVHSLILLFFFPLLYAAWPFPATPMVVPIWFIALALAVKLMVANLQRM